ncbi:glycosyltransferase family 8 protein [Pleomassaria siparia CBS 279.74]|uniref:Glycosyltransferase family 8 protein n=1 Tax=Pleomassaria siparia CBS 279.74 TaxID=1314801 RepID=A0A6G1KJV4_9PLEO|nr:glycosyltransferase family 8 protein [Pleomassaria siparia CBS 279.74]
MKTTPRRGLLLVAAVALLFTTAALLFLGIYHHTAHDVTLSREEEEEGFGMDWKTEIPLPVHRNPDEKLAYAIFLSGTLDQDEDLENDDFFVAVRIVVWQLLHKKDTRALGIDVVVIVTPSVTPSRRALLKKDGAMIHPVELLHTKNDSWIHQDEPRWKDVMTKLVVLQMTQYNRVLLLDGDTLLRSRLDGVFDDPAAQILNVLPARKKKHQRLEGEAPLPSTYLMAGKFEVHCWNTQHDFPPKKEQINVPSNFNAGFIMFAPSEEMFNYYVSFLDIKDSFDPKYPEQNLLNHVHRRDGPMPWKPLNFRWNTICPNEVDFELGMVSAHEKWWGRDPGYGTLEEGVTKWLMGQRWEMKGWYDGWNAVVQIQNEERPPPHSTNNSTAVDLKRYPLLLE